MGRVATPSVFLACLLLAACSELGMGKKKSVSARAHIVNNSDNPVKAAVTLNEDSFEDDCSPDTNNIGASQTVQPHSTADLSLSWSCGYPAGISEIGSVELDFGAKAAQHQVVVADMQTASLVARPLAAGDHMRWFTSPTLDHDVLKAPTQGLQEADYSSWGIVHCVCNDTITLSDEAYLKHPVLFDTNNLAVELDSASDSQTESVYIGLPQALLHGPATMPSTQPLPSPAFTDDGFDYFTAFPAIAQEHIFLGFSRNDATITCDNTHCAAN